jgi:predicted TIM-barrel enzyme
MPRPRQPRCSCLWPDYRRSTPRVQPFHDPGDALPDPAPACRRRARHRRWAGTGLSAKCAEAGGADLIIIYNSGRGSHGRARIGGGMMPYGDANAIVMDMAREVLPVVNETPVLAGVCGTDPFRLMPAFLREVRAVGFSGVQNFPTVGLIDGTMRAGLEETGMG